MHKFWKIRDSKANRLILIKEKTIYIGNPKQDVLNKLNSETTNFTFLEGFFSIPYGIIRRIENPCGKNKIKIFYGSDSDEDLILKDKLMTTEIFEFLKHENPKFDYGSELPTVTNYIKPQLFALFITTALFFWCLYLAFQIENGVEYELIGRGSPGISGIILGLASFGVIKIVTGFIILLSIIAIAIKRRLTSRSETEFLQRLQSY